MQEKTPQAVKNTLSTVTRAQQMFISNVLTEKPGKLYAMDDYKSIREALYDNVKNAVTKRFPLYNDRYSLELDQVDYDDPDDFDLKSQKQAILERKSLTRRLRGSWVLKDANGKEVSRTRRMTLMRVPYMTDRGTFIRNGAEYAFTNIMRLQPGVYTRQKPDEISAQFNIEQGTGHGFSLNLNPKTGIFQVRRGTMNAPAYTVLHDMGVSDATMQKAWGDELFAKNRQMGTTEKAVTAANKIYQKG